MSGLVCGSLGASRISDALATTQKGWGASRANLMAELIVERLTGERYETYSNAAMQRGLEIEPQARGAYEFYTERMVVQTEPILHPKIVGSHCSPDGIVGDDGLVELKCTNSATHLDAISGKFDKRYVTQCHWQMAVTGRKWCDLAYYDPRFPENMRLCISRIGRDEKLVEELERSVREFLAELDAKQAELVAKFGIKASA